MHMDDIKLFAKMEKNWKPEYRLWEYTVKI